MPVADPSLTSGDVVVVVSAPLKAGAVFNKSTKAYQSGVAGVISTQPGVALGSEAASSKPVALAGRVPVNVTLEGGAIAIGDYLVASSTPGKAMRALDDSASGILDVALSGYDGTSVAAKDWGDGIAHEAGHQVMMLVQLGGGGQKALAKLKARADQADARFDALKDAFCAQTPHSALCKSGE